MPSVTNRQTFKEYCLRRLGFPTIEINVDDDQVEDRIDDAFQYWQDYHFDALQKVYYIKAITQIVSDLLKTEIREKLIQEYEDEERAILELLMEM